MLILFEGVKATKTNVLKAGDDAATMKLWLNPQIGFFSIVIYLALSPASTLIEPFIPNHD